MVTSNPFPTGCPRRETLSDLVLGQLQPDALDGMSAHLAACASCQSALEDLAQQTDSFIETLRERAAAEQYRDEHPLAAALTGIRALSSPGATGRSLAGASPAAASAVDVPPAEPVESLKQIHEYRLLAQLGQGGMGTVYKALHVRLHKVVALKVLPAEGLSGDQAVSRFAREMEIVGQLDHRHIVCAHDAGEWRGRHFLVMEYVPGPDVHRLVAELGPLPLAEACEIARQAALGLAHAHQHGIVHRDIKPGNLILSRSGQVKLLDLGMARWRTERLMQDEITDVGQVMGTLDYLPPEQASNSHTVDARADLYSLGCTLYKLLAGHAPFAVEPFSTPASKIAAHERTTPASLATLRDDLPAELVALVEQTLAKHPADRPRDAAEVARRLEPYCRDADLEQLVARVEPLAGESENLADSLAISQIAAAGRPAAGQRDGAPRRRRAIALVGGATVLAVGLLLLFGNAMGLLKPVDRRQPATGVAQSDVAVPGDRALGVSPAGATGAQIDRHGDPLPDGARMRLGSIRLRHGGLVLSVAYSPDGTTLASGGGDSTLRLWDANTGREKWARNVYSYARQVAFAPNGKIVSAALGTGLVRNFDRRGELLWARAVDEQGANSLAYSPDGAFLAAGGVGGRIVVLRMKDAETASSFPAHDGGVNRVLFTPQGEELITAGNDGQVKRWSWREGELAQKYLGHEGAATCVALSPDGKQLAAGGIDRQVIVWDLATGMPTSEWIAHDAPVRGLAFSDDETLISVGDDGQIFGWDWRQGMQQFAVAGHDAAIQEIALSPDGQSFATAGCSFQGKPGVREEVRDNTIRLWETGSRRRIIVNSEFHRPLTGLAMTRDGQTLVTATQDRSVAMWNLATGQQRQRIDLSGNAWARVAISPDDALLAISGDYVAPIYRMRDGELVETLRREGFGRLHSLEFLNGSQTLVAGGQSDARQNSLYFWDRASGRLEVSSEHHEGFIWQLAVSRDQRLIATVSWDHTLAVWDATTRKMLFRGREHSGFVRGVAISPNGEWVATASDDATIGLWEVSSGKLVHRLDNDFGASSVQFAADNQTVIVGDYGGRIRFWDRVTDQVYAEFLPRIGVLINDLLVSHDGRTLVAGNSDSTALVWDLQPILQRRPTRPPAPSQTSDAATATHGEQTP